MYFTPNNLFVLVLVLVLFLAWGVVATRKPELKDNLLSYAVLAFASGVLVRSFANEWWALLLLGVVAAGLWAWHLLKKGFSDKLLVFGVLVASVLVGFGVRSINLWVAMIVVVALAALSFTGKLPKLSSALQK